MTNAKNDVVSREAAIMAARAADSKKATDIMIQDVSELIGVTDYFVIVTAANARQVDAIVDEIEEVLRATCAMRPLGKEVSEDGSWSLLDYGCIVIHVFQPDARDHYRIESLWCDAPTIDLSQEEGFENLEYSERISALIKAH